MLHKLNKNQIQTFGGTILNVLAPTSQDIHIEDIAVSLSRLCRFNGHTRIFYPVSEHSIEVARKMLKLFPRQRRDAYLWGLLHDAPEAYIGDIPSPIKRNLDHVKEIEGKFMEVIAKKYMIPWPCPFEDDLKICDQEALEEEADAFLSQRPSGPLSYCPALTPEEWKTRFANAFSYGLALLDDLEDAKTFFGNQAAYRSKPSQSSHQSDLQCSHPHRSSEVATDDPEEWRVQEG